MPALFLPCPENLRNSWMFARYYADQTLKNHEVVQLHAPGRTGWFAPLVLPDYDGKALPLWRIELQPNFGIVTLSALISIW